MTQGNYFSVKFLIPVRSLGVEGRRGGVCDPGGGDQSSGHPRLLSPVQHCAHLGRGQHRVQALQLKWEMKEKWGVICIIAFLFPLAILSVEPSCVPFEPVTNYQ